MPRNSTLLRRPRGRATKNTKVVVGHRLCYGSGAPRLDSRRRTTRLGTLPVGGHGPWLKTEIGVTQTSTTCPMGGLPLAGGLDIEQEYRAAARKFVDYIPLPPSTRYTLSVCEMPECKTTTRSLLQSRATVATPAAELPRGKRQRLRGFSGFLCCASMPKWKLLVRLRPAAARKHEAQACLFSWTLPSVARAFLRPS